jgi:hypothetical protein
VPGRKAYVVGSGAKQITDFLCRSKIASQITTAAVCHGPSKGTDFGLFRKTGTDFFNPMWLDCDNIHDLILSLQNQIVFEVPRSWLCVFE